MFKVYKKNKKNLAEGQKVFFIYFNLFFIYFKLRVWGGLGEGRGWGNDEKGRGKGRGRAGGLAKGREEGGRGAGGRGRAKRGFLVNFVSDRPNKFFHLL